MDVNFLKASLEYASDAAFGSVEDRFEVTNGRELRGHTLTFELSPPADDLDIGHVDRARRLLLV